MLHQKIRINIVLLLLVFVSSSISRKAGAQPTDYSVLTAHSHNDYATDTPFYKAYREGFGSIEADIYPVGEILYVSHNKQDIKKENTLQSLYLQPLATALKEAPGRQVQLLIDIKENHPEALRLLIKELQPLHPFIRNHQLTVMISGNRPLPSQYHLYPIYIHFDDDLVHPHHPGEWERVGLVSLQFTIFSTWKGEGDIDQKEEDRLRRIINSIHNAGKKVRFWEAPDTEPSWKEQMKLGVDYIGTDKIHELAHFLHSRPANKADKP